MREWIPAESLFAICAGVYLVLDVIVVAPRKLQSPDLRLAPTHERRAFDKRNQPKYNPWRARSEYAKLLGTGEHKASWRARFGGLEISR